MGAHMGGGVRLDALREKKVSRASRMRLGCFYYRLVSRLNGFSSFHLLNLWGNLFRASKNICQKIF
jgi:hypothetical protein